MALGRGKLVRRTAKAQCVSAVDLHGLRELLGASVLSFSERLPSQKTKRSVSETSRLRSRLLTSFSKCAFLLKAKITIGASIFVLVIAAKIIYLHGFCRKF